MVDFNFKKKYGQNFIQDQTVIDKIVTSINPQPDDLIIEIGPGAGALTKELKKYNSYLLAFEIDEDTKEYLLPLENEKVKIIYEDILKTDIKKYITNINYKKLYIIGNLPYYITTPIIERIISLNLNETSLTIMVQKEVGERFLAHCHQKEYGYITVILNYWYIIEQLIDVSKNSFYPKPKVDSKVIKLVRKDTLEIDYEKFKKIVKNSFQFKRKTIGNNLKQYDTKLLSQILEQHHFNLLNRAEDLDLETFIDISENL